MLIMLCHISPEFYFLLCCFTTLSAAIVKFWFISHTPPEGNTIYIISLEMKLTSSTASSLNILNTQIFVVLTYLLHIQTSCISSCTSFQKHRSISNIAATCNECVFLSFEAECSVSMLETRQKYYFCSCGLTNSGISYLCLH